MPARHRLYLDLSRLLRAAWRETPSGIERVELAYAREFGGDGSTVFVAQFLGQIHCLPGRRTSAFLESLENSWMLSRRPDRFMVRCQVIAIYGMMIARAAIVSFDRRPQMARNAVYMNLSHENLVSSGAIRRFKARYCAKMLCFVHDLIPITHPEFVKPGQARRHRRRMASVAGFADAVIVNSNATMRVLLAHFQGRQALPAIHVVPLGVKICSSAGGPPKAFDPELAPYFVCVATIEPRKNHLLLLHVWRSLASGTPPVPRLVLVGRRGWENEMVLDILERGTALFGIVEERRGVDDRELAALLKDARALLLPSFAEGYGLPVAEALAAGTPVICSDLPALHEVGGNAPEFLDPLDGLGWRQAIIDYAQPASERRAAQCQRILAWQAPCWESHFNHVREITQTLAGPGRMQA